MSSINVLNGHGIAPKIPTISPRRKWAMLVVLSLALAIIILDTTILNVALSYIIRDLKTDIQSIQWVITAYSLTLAALTITGGRMGDFFGRKRMFILGAVLFAIGSFIASISTSVPMLIAGESIIEGIGAALMMPATASLLVANFVGRERAIAFGVWGGIAGAAAALGPILGGYLTTNYNWRWGFRINLFVVLALLIGSVLIPESRDTKEKAELDLVGVGLSATGMLSLVFGIIEASKYGWWIAKETFTISGHALTMPWNLSIVPLFVFVGLVILSIFGWWELRRERKGHTPLVSMSIFKNRQFTTGVFTTAIMSLGQTGLVFALPVFLQSVRGLNAFDTGMSLLPMSLALLIVAPLSAAISRKLSAKFIINTGLLVNVIAYIVLRQTLSVDTTGHDLIPGLALFGVGMGLVMSQINNFTLSAVPVHMAGEASGINNTLRQVGSTLGAAIIGTILIGSLSTRLNTGIISSSVIPTELKQTLAIAVETQTSNVEFGGGAHVSGQLPDVIKQEIVSISHHATVDANRETLIYGAIFAFFGFVASLFLPSAATMARKAQQKMQVAPALHPLHASVAVDTHLVAELINADERRRANGKSGLGRDLRVLLDSAAIGQSVSTLADPRLVEARILWDAGWGSAVGFSSFANYLTSLPMVPDELRKPDSDFPGLILVDARISVAQAAQALGIAMSGITGFEQMKSFQQKGEAYWIRCHDGRRNIGKSARTAVISLPTNERAMNAIEGLALATQHPELFTEQYLDLPAEGSDHIPCLGTWNGAIELRWRWADHADPRCQTATCRV